MKNKRYLSLGLLLLLFLGEFILVLPTAIVSAQTACPTAPSMKVSVQIPTNGNYGLWLRATIGSEAPLAVAVRFDQETTCYNFKVPAAGAFQWISAPDGLLRRNLTAGAHDAYLMVEMGELHADKFLITGNTSCTPQGDGTNCLDQNVDIRLRGLVANQAIEGSLDAETILSGAELASPRVEYYFDNTSTPYAVRTTAPFCLFVSNGQCASGDISSLGTGEHSLKIVISAANLETTTKRVPFRLDKGLTPNPSPSPTPTPPSSPSPTPTPSPSPTPAPSPAPKPTTSVTPAKTNTVVVGTSVTGTTKTLTGQKSVTVAPSQPLTTGDKVSYAVNNKPVGSVTMGNETTDPSVPVDLTTEKNGDATISATIDRADGSSETYGVKTKVDNSKVATTQSWFARTGVKLIATTISIVMAIVGGILIFRAIKQRREYAEMHNLDSYQYVQPQSDVGAYSLPPLAVLVFAAGAVFASLTGAEVARVGVVVDLTKASLPTEYSLVNDAAGNYIQMRSLEHSMPSPTPSTAPTPTPSSNSNYAERLAKIKASTFRNNKEDNSPYINTPSADLYNKSDLYAPSSIYFDTFETDPTMGFHNDPVWFELGYHPGNGAGVFRAECEVSHFGYDDPIVYPGQPGASHLHMFMGNTHTNAYSTYDTLLNSGGSTCNGGELNRTAYWVPAMFDGKGNVVAPSKIRFYYKTEQPVGIGKVVTYPENLQIVADNTNNVDGNGSLSSFRCNSMYNGAQGVGSNNIPVCGQPANGQPGALEYQIFFDYCWNGNETTAGDWKANAGENGQPGNLVAPLNFWHSSVCPASHPKLLPGHVTHIFYDLQPGETTAGWFLASDVNPSTGKLERPRGSSAHADWFGAWNKQINKEWVDNCSNVLNAECGFGLLADPKTKDNPVRALKRRNDWIAGPRSPFQRIPVSTVYEQMCGNGKSLNPENGYAEGAYCRP